MDGAFVGLADDGTATSQNSAGLIGQSNSVQFSLTDVIPIVEYEYTAAGIDAEGKKNRFLNPNFFANYNVNEKLAFGLSAFVPASIGLDYNF
ncbi:MAG: long-chain fatty acid transport protein [Candidatus Cloacimonadota bacterium]|jgi:long-subunit fatty acid transport protein|nr:long-chain fatty acid transport protein [Candidatus Cloacimonadota bacterium]